MTLLNNQAAVQRRRFFHSSAGLIAASMTLPSLAVAFPERPISFICPWPAGGTADMTMRALCAAASKSLGQPIVFENKPGASGMLGLKAMASAKPDGYTIGQVPISITRFSQLGMVQLDPLKDLAYIARTSGQNFGIAVPANSPAKTLQEFVAMAKAKPGVVSYGSSGVGSATHVGMEEFALAAGAQFNHVPFKGGADALQAVLGGHIDALADSSSWAPHVKAGKLRLLATWGAERTTEFKDAPTLKDAGYNDVVDAPNGIAAPKGIDTSVMTTLREAFRVATNSAEFKTACDKIDAPVLYLSGADYEKYIAEVYQKETRLIDRLKLKELMAKG